MDLFPLGLTDTLRAYREGRATVQDYVTSCSNRIAHLEPRIQAWEWFDASRAMADAEERAGGILADLPLYGIPVGVKDIINTRGIPTRMGSRIFQNTVPSHSAWVVRRLESLGGLVMGKTVTTEFAFRAPGKTRNPWNPAHTPGGSSSGSAAAVAAGFVPIAIGTQTLGSVIRPAAFCGVVGYKPSHGAISRSGIHPLSATLDTVHVPREPRPGPPRLAMVKTSKWNLATQEQRDHFMQTATRLQEGGADVREVSLPKLFDKAWDNVMTILSRDAVKSFQLIESRH